MLGRVEPIDDVAELMAGIGRKARAAAQPLSIASPEQKMIALIAMADSLRVAGEASSFCTDMMHSIFEAGIDLCRGL